MKTTIINITPERAQHLLDSSPGNRPLNTGNIAAFSRDMATNRWHLTHQGLLLGHKNMLIDGHHRMHALIKANKAQEFMVTINPELRSPLDQNIDRCVRRKDAYSLGRGNELVSVAKLAADLITGNKTLSLSETSEWVNILEPYYMELRLGGGTAHVRALTVAPYYLAAIVRMMHGDSLEVIKTLHKSMCTSDFPSMTPLCSYFYRMLVVKQINMNRREFYVRALRTFNPKNQNAIKMILNDLDDEHDEAREFTKAAFEKEKIRV